MPVTRKQFIGGMLFVNGVVASHGTNHTQNPTTTIDPLSTVPSSVPTIKVSTALLYNSSITDIKAARKDPVLLEAIHDWKRTGHCNDNYFDLRLEQNRIDSKSDEWYSQWVVNAQTNDLDNFLKFGEATYFGLKSWNGLDFRCGVYNNGCEQAPKCEELMRHSVAKNLKMTTAEQLDLTRKMYFSQKKMVNLSKFVYFSHKTMGFVTAHVGIQANTIAGDFARSNSAMAEMTCKLMREIFDTCFSFMIAGLNDGKKLGKGAGTLSEVMGQAKHWIMDTIPEMVDSIRDHRLGAGNGTSGLPAPGYAKGFCVAYGAGIPDENYKMGSALGSLIATTSKDYRTAISDLLDQMVMGSSNGSILHQLMMRSDWSVEYGEFQHSAAEIEQIATDIFKKETIMALLSNEKCYVKCTNMNNDNNRLCNIGAAGDKLGARTCYPDGHACQVQCLTSNARRNNHETPLFGMDNLEKHNLTLPAILTNSVARYEAHKGISLNGNNDPLNQATLVEDYGLPVCRSSLFEMGDIDNKLSHNRWKSHKQFACSCGDWRSSETKAFMNQIGMGIGQSDMINKRSKQTLTLICPREFKKLLPATSFLAHCEQGTRMPHKWDSWTSEKGKLWGMHQVRMGRTDARCPAIKRHTEGMTELEASIWFCQKSEDAKKVFKSEKKHAEVDGGGFAKSHYRKCKQFNTQYTSYEEPTPSWETPLTVEELAAEEAMGDGDMIKHDGSSE